MIIKSYKEIIYMINSIEQLNLLKQEIWFNSSEIRDYEIELNDIKKNAASFYYEKANELMQKKDQESFKRAAQSFKIFLSPRPSPPANHATYCRMAVHPPLNPSF